MVEGVIVRGIGSFYDVAVTDAVIRCRARGRLRKTGLVPMVGDRVRIMSATKTQEGSIEEILARKNVMLRPAVANIDTLAVVIAAVQPEPDLLLVDKLFITAEMQDITPILVINKIDLASEEALDALQAAYAGTKYPIYRVSGKQGIGLKALSLGMSKGIATLAGQSGVGKSSILNRIHPPLDLETGAISQRVQRGKHTTRHVELLALPFGGRIVDTPGFSAMEISSFEPNILVSCYPEFAPYSSACRFRGCIHYREPDCAVQESVAAGTLNLGRYERYKKIMEEMIENRRDPW